MLVIFMENHFPAMIMHFKSLWWGCLPPETAEIAEITKIFDDRLYSAILRSLEQTHCARMEFYTSD